jgi:integrase
VVPVGRRSSTRRRLSGGVALCRQLVGRDPLCRPVRWAQALLAAVCAEAPAFEAFFGCIYYAAMRPSEVRNIRAQDLRLPKAGWGEATLRGSCQDAGKAWTDDGELGEERGLKHRSRTAVRPVPLAPPLVELLRRHLEEFETGPDGWLS